jgi:Zn-dependent protease
MRATRYVLTFAADLLVNGEPLKINMQRLAIVVFLSLASIVFHEFGHFVVYKSAGVPVPVTLQSVRPVVDLAQTKATLRSASLRIPFMER